MSSPPDAFSAAVAALNAQRAALGDTAVDAAIAALTAALTGRSAAAQGNPGPAMAPSPAGQPPREVSQPTPTSAPAMQRLRQVSVLFVDVVDSTHLLQQVGVEDAPAVVDAAVQRFAALVQRRGGQVLRFTGDGLKAAFGAEAVREDGAERAVRAGLDILEAARAHALQLRESLRVEGFAVRVGIHTGPVVLGGGAEADRSAIGHAVHLAARMEQSAPQGRLRISQDTWAQVRGLFEVQAQPPLMVKGHDEPLVTHLVLSAVTDADRTVRRGIEGLVTPMVGREAPLQRLLDAHAQARAAGRLVAVTVVADAGVGKTRLRREFLARLGLEHEGPGMLLARAHPDTLLQPYGLLRQLLARWLKIADDLDGEAARQRLQQGLAHWLGAQGNADAQALGQLVGMDFGASAAVQALAPRELRARAFGALTEALRRLAAAQPPLTLVLDDLHWADEASLEFLDHLAGAAGAAAAFPLMLLMLARPALRERRAAPLAAGAAEHALIELAALDAEQGPALAAALLRHLPDAPQALTQLLVQRAEGNPFYMEELVRMLIDDGVIDAHQRPWKLMRHWQQTVRLPATLVGVLQARLDALPAHELSALQQASVVGPVFWDAALAALDERAPAALPSLQRRSLVLQREGSAFANARELAFHHQLLHDVTYDTLLGPARRAGHARAARWLAERVADRAGEFLGITAEHFERAGDSAMALEYYDRARADAARRYAHEAVLAYIERALGQSALSSPKWRYQLLVSRHNTLESMGRVEAAERALSEVEAFAHASASDAMRADVMVSRMFAADRAGHAARAEALAREVVALAERAQAPGAAALGHGELAWLALMRNEYARADHHIAAGIPWARRCAQLPEREGGYDGYEQQLRVLLIESLLGRERPFDASRAIAEALAVLPTQKRRDRFNLLLRDARARTDTGEFEAAQVLLHEAGDLAQELQIPRLEAEACNIAARVALLQGDLDQCERAARRAETIARASDLVAALAAAQDDLATVARSRGQNEAARALWNQALAQFAELQGTEAMHRVRVRLAELDAHEGRRTEAVAAVRQLLEDDAPGPVDAEATGTWPQLNSATLATCAQLLQGEADAAALAAAVRGELMRRLNELRVQAPDTAARARLEGLPHWHTTLGSSASA